MFYCVHVRQQFLYHVKDKNQNQADWVGYDIEDLKRKGYLFEGLLVEHVKSLIRSNFSNFEYFALRQSVAVNKQLLSTSFETEAY